MSSMMDTSHFDGAPQNGIAQAMSSVTPLNIKRLGGRPLKFNGSELAMAMSYTPSFPYWYEINLYQSEDRQCVATVRLFYQSDEFQDTVRAWKCPSLDDAIAKIELYDAGQDVALALGVNGAAQPAAELAAQALELRAKIADYRRHYQSLVGELFHEMDVAA